MDSEQLDGPNGEGSSSILDEEPQSVEFMKYIHNLAKQIKELCEIDKTINLRNNLNEYNVFVLELKTFLRELGCPHKSLIKSDLEVTMRSKKNRQILLNYLLSKLEFAKKVKNSFPIDDPTEINSDEELDYQTLSENLGDEVNISYIKELIRDLKKIMRTGVIHFFLKRKRTIIQTKNRPIKEDQAGPYNFLARQNTYNQQSTPSQKNVLTLLNSKKRVTQYGNRYSGYGHFNQGGRYHSQYRNYRNWEGQGYRHPTYGQNQNTNFIQYPTFFNARDPMHWNKQKGWNSQDGSRGNWDNRKVTFYNNGMDKYESRNVNNMLQNQIGYPINEENDFLMINYNQGHQAQPNIQNQDFGSAQMQDHRPLSYADYHHGRYQNNFSPVQLLHNQSDYSYGLNQGRQPQLLSQNQFFSYTDQESYDIADYNRNSKFKNIWTKGQSASQMYDESIRKYTPIYQGNGHGYGPAAQATQQAYPNVHGEYMTYR